VCDRCPPGNQRPYLRWPDVKQRAGQDFGAPPEIRRLDRGPAAKGGVRDFGPAPKVTLFGLMRRKPKS
jgi:hypothetical protein